MSRHLDRAQLLIQQNRYEQAEEELHRNLIDEPECALTHSLLAVCLVERDQWNEATRHAEQAIAFQPDNAHAHRILAFVLLRRNRPREALAVVDEAVRLEPGWADVYGLKGLILLRLKRWKEALHAAEEGLGIDPDDVECINVRGLALVQLGDRRAAEQSVRRALEQNPDNSDTHANMGWTALSQQEPHRAVEHFREALRLEPDNEWARTGMVEALKARNIVYRLMLRFFMWAGRLSGQAQIMLILGLVFGQRILSGLFAGVRGFEWLGTLIFAGYLLFAVLTWTARPLFNLMLRMDKFGRHVLSRKESAQSNWVALFLLGAASTFGLFAWLLHAEGEPIAETVAVSGMLGVRFLFLLIPLCSSFHAAPGWPKLTMRLATIGLTALAYGGLAIGFLLGDIKLMMRLLDLSFLGTILSTWLGLGVLSVPQRH
jgi:tetratricopeptide (TPR) repeat protein